MSREHSGDVKMTTRGPTFYVDEHEDSEDFPIKWADNVTDELNLMMSTLDEEYDKQVSPHHVKPNVVITQIHWDEDGFEVDEFDLNGWYSDEQINSWDY